MSISGPLTRVVVADFSPVLAGPYATTLLGDLGATVIVSCRHRRPSLDIKGAEGAKEVG